MLKQFFFFAGLAYVSAEDGSSLSAESHAVGTLNITDCHFHGASQFCTDDAGNEGFITPIPVESAPSSYTACHTHGSDTFCLNGDSEIQFVLESDTASDHDHSSATENGSGSSSSSDSTETSSGASSSASESASSASSSTGGATLKQTGLFTLAAVVFALV